MQRRCIPPLWAWDTAAWPGSPAVQAGRTTPKRHATHPGGSRVMVCRFPRQIPWRHPMAPTWGQRKRAIVDLPRMLSMVALRPRVCADDPGELTDPRAPLDC